MTPTTQVLPYLRSNMRPLRLVMWLNILFTVVAGAIEVWLISYAGHLIDTLADTDPLAIW